MWWDLTFAEAVCGASSLWRVGVEGGRGADTLSRCEGKKGGVVGLASSVRPRSDQLRELGNLSYGHNERFKAIVWDRKMVFFQCSNVCENRFPHVGHGFFL